MESKLKSKEVCQILGISYPTLVRYMNAGKITYYKTSPSRTAKVFFLKSDVEKYLQSIKNN